MTEELRMKEWNGKDATVRILHLVRKIEVISSQKPVYDADGNSCL